MNASILVIEDDSSIQELIVEFLSSQGYNVDFASDGLEGISKFKQGNYDLIILDIMMPNLDGYSVSLYRPESNITQIESHFFGDGRTVQKWRSGRDPHHIHTYDQCYDSGD